MRIVLPLLLLALAASACMPRNEGGAAAAPDAAHTSRNALDWGGAYEGVLPCTDCPGIRTRLTLRRDETFELSTQRIEREPAPRVVGGRFTWQANGNAITLDAQGGAQQFAVGEGRIALLDAGAAPAWPQPAQRILQRVAPLADADLQRTLEAHRWTLTAASGSQGRALPGLPAGAGRPIVLSFADGRVGVEGGCNRSFGGYRIEPDGRLKIGRMASTMMACEPAAMQVDTALADLLAEPMKIDLTPGLAPTLRLVTAAGASLALSGRMTPEARYGAPTRMFLEVAPQTVACNNPPSGASACLQVRDRRYDAQGLLVGAPGAWQPLHDPIEGFAHQPGVRNLLRLKRFDRGAAAAGPRYLYVLDLVVESETVQR